MKLKALSECNWSCQSNDYIERYAVLYLPFLDIPPSWHGLMASPIKISWHS